MIRNKLIILFLSFFLITGKGFSQKNKSSLILGVNGHPLNKLDYTNTPVSEQIQLLQEINASSYRIDVSTNASGKVIEESLFLDLVTKLRAQKISVLPMLYLTGFSLSLSESQAYEKGYNLGGGFAKRYGKFFEYYELGNELEIDSQISSNSGSYIKDYSLKNVRVQAAFLRGMIAGLKEINSNCKTIVNCGGWFHFVYLELLATLGVPYDIAGYHWYSDMDNYSISQNINIFTTISSRLSKPIWFTEINYIEGDTEIPNEKKRSIWLLDFIKRCKEMKNVQAIFIYELLDELDLQNTNKREKSFGLFSRKSYNLANPKSILSDKWIFKESSSSIKKLGRN